ncbi:MAG: hypothetical protein JKX85_01270 [Phycisphaeraceae bacterium]|nr:hypothetical protein [Phycisphaeraceae bacterium]
MSIKRIIPPGMFNAMVWAKDNDAKLYAMLGMSLNMRNTSVIWEQARATKMKPVTQVFQRDFIKNMHDIETEILESMTKLNALIESKHKAFADEMRRIEKQPESWDAIKSF